jgi:hypothetical protein
MAQLVVREYQAKHVKVASTATNKGSRIGKLREEYMKTNGGTHPDGTKIICGCDKVTAM